MFTSGSEQLSYTVCKQTVFWPLLP
uniref:Uncharacterized protein n=1 Tax=Rhizophora mucronata TaxID=61149 RepID=A0A2P2QLR0_RHIMU